MFIAPPVRDDSLFCDHARSHGRSTELNHLLGGKHEGRAPSGRHQRLSGAKRGFIQEQNGAEEKQHKSNQPPLSLRPEIIMQCTR